MRSMEKIIHDQSPRLKIEKRYIKSNRSWNTEEEDEVMNILLNGLDIWSLRPHGNQNLIFTGVVEILQEYQEHHQL